MAKSKVLIENDKTIVTEWSFDVGDSTGIHTHEYNYIVVPMLVILLSSLSTLPTFPLNGFKNEAT